MKPNNCHCKSEYLPEKTGLPILRDMVALYGHAGRVVAENPVVALHVFKEKTE